VEQVNALKKDIQQMEEEKTLVQGKIARLQRKVMEMVLYTLKVYS
jgi:hypothetical protein